MRLRRLIAIGVTALLVGACGDDEPDRTSASPTPPPIGAPQGTPTPTATATATPPRDATVTPSPAPGEDEGGDEDGNRVGIDFTIDGEGITPPRIEVIAFLGWRVRIRNDLPDVIEVDVAGREVSVPGGETTEIDLPGRRPGRYTVDAGPAGRAVVVAASG